VDFKKLGGFGTGADPGPDTGSTYNRTYDNGSYNKVDISGNAGGTTWFWGYENGNQQNGRSIVMETTTSANDASSKDNQENPQHGFEISYSRLLKQSGSLKFGLEAAFGYELITASSTENILNHVERISDSFDASSILIPLAPYHGTFEGPGALISSTPDRTRSVIARDALIVGHRSFDATVYTIRLGPYMEFPIYKKLTGFLNGGLLLVIGDSVFAYTETVTILDTGDVTSARRSSGSQTDFLVGGYVGGGLQYDITDRISLMAGAQFQGSSDSVTDSHTIGGNAFTKKQAVLNLGESVVVTVGVGYSF